MEKATDPTTKPSASSDYPSRIRDSKEARSLLPSLFDLGAADIGTLRADRMESHAGRLCEIPRKLVFLEFAKDILAKESRLSSKDRSGKKRKSLGKNAVRNDEKKSFGIAIGKKTDREYATVPGPQVNNPNGATVFEENAAETFHAKSVQSMKNSERPSSKRLFGIVRN